MEKVADSNHIDKASRTTTDTKQRPTSEQYSINIDSEQHNAKPGAKSAGLN